MGRKKWDSDSIKKAFKDYKENGKPLQAKKFRKDNPSLYGAILYHFKSYKVFIEEIGLNYDEIADKKRWTNEKVIEEFKKILNEGYEINPKSISNNRVDLYAQITERFGSYKEFIEMMGFNYKEICKSREWTKSEIKDAILNRSYEGKSLQPMDLISDHFSLYKASTNCFGSYKNALEYSGINYFEQIGDMDISAKFGFRFEHLLSEMFEDLSKNYVRHSRKIDGILPDFFDEVNNIFIDAKLSSWTVFQTSSSTIEKYLPHCSKLIVVYLRGPKINRKLDGLELRHVSYYFKELKEQGLAEYIAKFEDLLSELDKSVKGAV